MTTVKQKQALAKIVENRGSVSAAMREVGYSDASAKNPKNLTESKGFKELMEAAGLTEEQLYAKHRKLLDSTRLDHMVFPLGPKKTEKQEEVINRLPGELATILDAEMAMAQTDLSDEDIVKMLAEVNCKVRKIVHGETARHVYFWAADNKAVKEALDMAYKLLNKYGDKQPPGPTTNNILIVNAPEVQSAIQQLDKAMKTQLLKSHVSENATS